MIYTYIHTQSPLPLTHLCSICRVHIDTAIHQRTVHVRHHGTHIASSVGLRLLQLEVTDRLLHAGVPGEVVALVDGVDQLLLGGQGHVLCGEDELSDGGVQGEALHAVAVGQHKLSGRAVCAVASHEDL